MGQEIDQTSFSRRDFQQFHERLHAETQLLDTLIRADALAHDEIKAGFELEICLVGADYHPLPSNRRFLAELASPRVVPELANFNVELNGTPTPLRGDCLRSMTRELSETWDSCSEVARSLGARMCTIGILPTVSVDDLTLANMSARKRFRALDQQLARGRSGNPLRIRISGKQRLAAEHDSVMLEAAATSFQIHIKMDPANATRVFNAATIIAAPMVAVSANSPFFLGRNLWAETRIPLFEQAVAQDGEPRRGRATLGAGYLKRSVIEYFERNRDDYRALLPLVQDQPTEAFAHLRLHNSTIWRWNRPLIGFNADGTPHLRVEHRVMPSGPTTVDSLANAALFFGLIAALSTRSVAPETQLPFHLARRNFYAAARHGLGARLRWLDGALHPVKDLLAGPLLRAAHRGLAHLGIDTSDVERYLGVIAARVRCEQNGSNWQRAYAELHPRQMESLTSAYLARQARGAPVHEWPL